MKRTLVLASLSAANIGVAFAIQWIILVQIGPGIETDALYAGMTVPQLVVTVLSGSLIHVLVPILSGIEKSGLQHDIWSLMYFVGGLFGILAAVMFASANLWVPVLVPGFGPAAQALTADLTRILLIGMVFSALNGVQHAVYHARNMFVRVESASLAVGILCLLLLNWALPRYGVTVAAWISTLRLGLQTLVLSPALGKPVRANLVNSTITSTWRRIRPLLVGTIYYKTDPVIDRYLLSSAPSGIISLYYFVQQMYGALNQIINSSISAPLVPKLCKLHETLDAKGFRAAIHVKLMQLGIVCSVVLIVEFYFGRQVIDLLIGYGSVNSSNLNDIWWMAIWLSGTFLGGGLGQIYASAFYATGDTRTPAIGIGIPIYTIYIPCKIFAYIYSGVQGLAISASIYFLCNFFIMAYIIEKRHWRGWE